MKVDVQDVGLVEFPDDAKPDEISKALNERYPSPVRIPKLDMSGIATDQAMTPEEFADMGSPIPAIGRTFNVAGKALAGGAEDVLSRLLTTKRQEEEVARSGAPEESNITSLARQISDSGRLTEPLPFEQDIARLPTAQKIAAKAAYGTVEAVPKIAAVAGLQTAGVPAPAGAAAVFGTTEQGFDPKQAAIAAAIPFIGKYGGEIAGAIAKKFGVDSVTALNAAKAAGGLGAPAAALIADGELEISKLPPEKQQDARIDLYSNILGQSALGPVGVKFESEIPTKPSGKIPVTYRELKQGEPNALQRETETPIQPLRQQPIEGAGKVPAAGTGEKVSARSEPVAQAEKSKVLLTADEVLSKPKGTAGPQEIASMPEEEYAKLISAEDETGSRLFKTTPEATLWALKQSPEIIPELKRLRDEVAKKNADSGYSLMDRSQWFSDAIHAIERDEVGQKNIATVTGKPSSEAAPRLYRESSIDEALEYIPGNKISSIRTSPDFVANAPELATGQGANKGVKLEFDPEGLQVTPHTAKPGAAFVAKQGKGEFILGNSRKDASKNLTAITVAKGAKGERSGLFSKLLSGLERQGWTKTENADGSTTYRKPSPGQVPTKSVGATEPAPVPQPEFIGMGGAVPSEFKTSPETPTSIKNATVDAERQQRGLPPAIQPAKRSFGAVWDETMAKIDRDPGYQDRLINELRDKPRALTDSEDAALLHRQIDLQNEYGKATRDLAQAYDDGRMDAVGDEKARVAAISDQLLDLYNIGKKVGTETGRGLNARKMMAYEDFSLAKMELEKRAANGGRPLTDAERAQITELQARIEKTQKEYDDYVAKTDQRIADLELKRALDQVEKDARKEPTIHPRILAEAERIVKIMEKSADAARTRLREKFARTSAGVDPTIITDLSIIGAAKIARGIVEFGKWSDAMVKDIGEGIQPFLEEAWKAANKKFDESMDKYAKAGTASQVKRAVKKTDVVEQQNVVRNTIKERLDAGKRDEISGQVQKLARLFVEQGVKTRDELIDRVHEVLQSIDPKFTRRETMDAISGYGDFRQLTKDEISVKLRDLKGQMQQVAKLEDMQANRPPLKTGLERRIPSQEESRLIKLVNEAKNQFQIPISDPNTQLKSSLDTLKTRLKNATLEYQDKLKRGDFSKKPKRILQMDAEANRLHFEATKAKIAWHEALMKDRLANRSIPAKILGAVGEVMNTSRAIMTSLDLSAVLRQGGFIALGHPIRALKAFPAMFRALRSEAGQHAVNQEIVARKNYPLYMQSKLYLSEHGQKLSQMEEAYMSRWADKIPLVAGSQRAYVTFLNKLRADSFDAMANALSRDGELTPKEASAISNFINVATGRGNLGMKENALVGLNTIFFAPRYVASRFQLLAGQPFYRGTARTRTLIAKEYARYLIGAAVVYGLAQMDGAKIEDDPRSADFGKLRYGNTRVDPMSGLLQTTVLLSRLGSGQTKTSGGKIVPIRGDKVPFGTGNSADVIARFARAKLAPVPGLVVNVLSGKDVVGQPVTPESVAKSLVVPLSLQDINQTMNEQGVPKGAALGILSLFGMGLQNYDDKKKTP